MKPLAREWVAKAEGDFATARRELRARKLPNFDAACFHAQQCAEKYLKALLQEANLRIPRTHDLDATARPLLDPHPELSSLRTAFRALSAYAVETRYPGRDSTRALARDAVLLATRIRSVVRSCLRLKRGT